MRLIDADALEEVILRETNWYDDDDEDIAYQKIIDAPTIKVVIGGRDWFPN